MYYLRYKSFAVDTQVFCFLPHLIKTLSKKKSFPQNHSLIKQKQQIPVWRNR